MPESLDDSGQFAAGANLAAVAGWSPDRPPASSPTRSLVRKKRKEVEMETAAEGLGPRFLGSTTSRVEKTTTTAEELENEDGGLPTAKITITVESTTTTTTASALADDSRPRCASPPRSTSPILDRPLSGGGGRTAGVGASGLSDGTVRSPRRVRAPGIWPCGFGGRQRVREAVDRPRPVQRGKPKSPAP
eukprot:Hpha_TRINITY_DN4193_c0_g1::TRINITY_DN4193_c0_g1_i1::g.194799::m.194799